MSAPTYPRRLAVAIDTDDLDERYRRARLDPFPDYATPQREGARGFWAGVIVLAVLLAVAVLWRAM